MRAMRWRTFLAGAAFYLALRVPVSLAFGAWLNYSNLGFPHRNGEPGA